LESILNINITGHKTGACVENPDAVSSASKTGSKAQAAVEQSGSGMVDSASVSLSSGARKLLELEANASQPGQTTASDFNAEHVAAVRHAIANGDYHINTAKIRDALLAEARELLK
jgi:flagellar biosynthesis anti-sigma factor FlgM